MDDDMSAAIEEGAVGGVSDKVSVQTQNSNEDDIESVLKDLNLELAKKEKELPDKQEERRVSGDERRLKTHIKKLKKWIEDAKTNRNMPDVRWRDMLKTKVGGQKSAVKIVHFPEYPDINSLHIKHARVLVLSITKFISVVEPEGPGTGRYDRTFDDSYAAVRRSFIDHYGYEDVLERIMINMIVLERMNFKTRITKDDINQALNDLETWFQFNDSDVEHLEHFNKNYKSLYDKIVTKIFWDEILEHFKNKKGSFECFQNTFWTSDEMKLMLEILIEDPKNKTNTNALIVLVSSHGNTNKKGETVIFDCQKKELEVNKIIKMFSKRSIQSNEELCCLLLFHACRGDKKQEDHCVQVKVLDNKTKRGGISDSETSCKNMQDMPDTGARKQPKLEEKTISLLDNLNIRPDDTKEDEEDFHSLKGPVKPQSQAVATLNYAELSLPIPPSSVFVSAGDGRHNVEAEPFSCDNFGSSGYCPNNCLVAYSTTPGFTAATDPIIGALYFEKLCQDMLAYKKLPLLPFLTKLNAKLVSEDCEMPTFDHCLTKMPILCRNRLQPRK